MEVDYYETNSDQTSNKLTGDLSSYRIFNHAETTARY